jgi:hypothetical protein
MSPAQPSLPPLVIAVILSGVVVVFGWAFAAAQYAHAVQGWRTEGVTNDFGNPFSSSSSSLSSPGFSPYSSSRGLRREADLALLDFAANAVYQLPQALEVIRYTLVNRRWLVAVLVLLELGVLALAWWMRSHERAWFRSKRRRDAASRDPR